jgi:hypothetical protein
MATARWTPCSLTWRPGAGFGVLEAPRFGPAGQAGAPGPTRAPAGARLRALGAAEHAPRAALPTLPPPGPPPARCDEANGWRSSVRGVFVSDVPRELPPCDADAKNKGGACLADYYKAVTDAIKDKCASPTYGQPMIFFNPGAEYLSCDFAAANGVGFVNSFENSYDVYLKVGGGGWITRFLAENGLGFWPAPQHRARLVL